MSFRRRLGPALGRQEQLMDVVIVGGGIGGLTLGLTLHAAGISCRVYEAAPEIKPLGVGINLLPHATKELAELGLLPALEQVAVTTTEIAYFNRFGQFIYSDPSGRFGGYEWPQFSIHRGDLQMVLLAAFIARAGADAVITGYRCVSVTQDGNGADVHFVSSATGAPLASIRGDIVVACDGIHSAVRKQFHPDEGPPRYFGLNMWRGVTRWKPYLTGASMVRVGWNEAAKLLVYPIRNDFDAEGRQLTNWVCSIAQDTPIPQRDWNRPGRLEDFLPAMADWRFDWLDVPAMCRAADEILEYPMMDQDPLPFWGGGRVTLLGDAAHPMIPRGANGGAQAILDCRALAGALCAHDDPAAALKAYEAERRPATAKVVIRNREAPPDAILEEVYRRTGDRPFRRIEDVISRDELDSLNDGYKRIAGFDHDRLRAAE
jgi:2-polyprenyl-6-methoxyphenol hydroxylase-like FAD-dependent oxidoreductase